jgi:hypothetical protein
MKRMTSFSFVVCFLLLSACATHTHAVTAVNLKVSSDTANKRFVNDVRNATLETIASQVPNARPMTVVVKLDVTSETRPTPVFVSGETNRQRVLASGPDPWKEGALPTVPVYTSAFSSQTTEDITEVRVSYTISDAAGRVVESHQLKLDPRFRHVNTAVVTPVSGFADTDPLSARRGLVTDTAGVLASRVKALSQ